MNDWRRSRQESPVRNREPGDTERNMNTSKLIRNAEPAEFSAPIRVVVLAVYAILVGGCDIATPEPPPPPPGGGSTYVLDYDVFVAEVAPILTARGCDDLSCHGGGIRGTFQLSPSDDKDVDMDFAQSRLQVDGDVPATSLLLAKPLSEGAGGLAHAGSVPLSTFDSVTDPDYQTILAWIAAGEFR